MTVSTTTSQIVFSSGTELPITFPFLDSSELVVVETTETGATTTLTEGEGSDYTVTGEGDPDGGTVTLASAIDSGHTVTVTRQTTKTQLTDLRNAGSFLPEDIETALDRMAMLLQELDRDMDTFTADVDEATCTATDGTVARTLESRFNEWLSFLDFWDGPLDGSEDCTTELVAALAAAGTDHVLWMPAGKFTISDSIDYSGRHIVGAGLWDPDHETGTLIEVDATLESGLLNAMYTSNLSGQLENITLDCNDKADNGIYADAASGGSDNYRGTIIRNVAIKGVGSCGLYGAYLKDPLIENVSVEDTTVTASGFYFEAVEGLNARALSAKDCYDFGFGAFETTGTVDGLELIDCSQGNAWLTSVWLDACTEGLYINGLRLYYETEPQNGIYIHDCTDVHFSGARLEKAYALQPGDTDFYCVELDNSTGCSGTGIDIIDNESSGNWESAASADYGWANQWSGSVRSSADEFPLYVFDTVATAIHVYGKIVVSAEPAAGNWPAFCTVWNSDCTAGQVAFWTTWLGGAPGTWVAGPIYPVPT